MRKRVLVLLTAAVCFLSGCANYVKDGTELLEQGEYEEAIAEFEQALDDEKESAEAYRGIGMAYYEMQDYEQAMQNLQQALALGCVETPVIYNLIGISAMNLEDYDSALDAFSKGTALPETGEAADSDETVDYSETIREMKYNQIVCYEKKLDWDNAETAAEAYVNAYPDDAEAQKELEFLRSR